MCPGDDRSIGQVGRYVDIIDAAVRRWVIWVEMDTGEAKLLADMVRTDRQNRRPVAVTPTRQRPQGSSPGRINTR